MSRGRTIIGDVLKELSAKPGKVVLSDHIATKLKEKPERVRDSLTGYARRYPDGPVRRIGPGVYQWIETVVDTAKPVSAQPAPEVANTWTPDEAAKVREAAAYANQIPTSETLKAEGGFIAPYSDADVELAVPALQVRRGGVKFPPPLEPGLKMEDATIVHVDFDVNERTTDVYFTWRGKMWKASTI